MGSDCDSQIRSKADQQLAEIDKKYPGFIQVYLRVLFSTPFKHIHIRPCCVVDEGHSRGENVFPPPGGFTAKLKNSDPWA